MKKKHHQAVADWREQDSAFAAEKQRYADPVPSREMILKVLGRRRGPMVLKALLEHFDLQQAHQQQALEKRLAAMIRDGQLLKNRKSAYGPVSQMNAIAGRVQAHRDGFGFLIPDHEGPDIFLPPRQMRSLMNGDHVLVRITGHDHKGRPEGALVEVLERGSREMVGRLHVERGVAYVIPDNPRQQQDLLIPQDAMGGARHGQMVVAQILAPPGNRTLPVGEVSEVLGEHLAPGMEIEAAIRAHSIPFEFPQAVLQEAAAVPEALTAEQRQGREDLRALPLVTIDGEDARDFDDAVCCMPVKGRTGGWRLWVAIADVSAYVLPGSALDQEAAERGNSVYFPQQVIPMLPEKLSNGLCSLNPRVDRLCMVCEMRIDPEGEVLRARFYEAVMCSQARLTYEQVAEALDRPKRTAAKQLDALLPQLRQLDDLFKALFAARQQRGAIEFESSDTRILFDEERKISRIVPVQRNRAHQIIEECMIAANVAAAQRVARRKAPAPYRIHEQPDAQKVQALREFLAERGLVLGGGDSPSSDDFCKLMRRTAKRPDRQVLHTVILRSMMQARYSAENLGHFGLALEHYGHFTSPIRRYPDLLLHRTIKQLIRKQKRAAFIYEHSQIEQAAAHCSMTGRRADEAVRDVTTWLKCEYMHHRVGQAYDGVISGIAAFGLFVQLDGLFLDGLVHVSQLKNDYYQYEARHHRLIGDNSGRTYNLGERLRVRVVRVDLDERKIDLEIVDEPKGASKGSSRIKRSGSRWKRSNKFS